MFTTGQLIFAIAFVLVFVAVIIRMYRKDRNWQREQYKGVVWVLIFFIGFVSLLVFLKYILRP
ncbi:hypothetical protein [Robiginitalea aurantiaca]|uniref:Uncharacterized protein n=1 Tax=Robiginitalea aurantiaca TaxID=3056915 RepID=A0ABT7WD69_9FLAO|nr:hypothetical protein [Robiginitalea aurantiaca]MDM9630851.1 hypothetical protein [Robiginitalea aurantiaca]